MNTAPNRKLTSLTKLRLMIQRDLMRAGWRCFINENKMLPIFDRSTIMGLPPRPIRGHTNERIFF
jgi:hypothetical protein